MDKISPERLAAFAGAPDTTIYPEKVAMARELLALRTEMAALETEAKEMPSAEAVLAPAGEGKQLTRFYNPERLIAAIEHDRLIHARRAQVRTEGMRKALQRVVDANQHLGFCGATEEGNGVCDCAMLAVDAALADEPADVLGEAVKVLRSGIGCGADPSAAPEAIRKVLALFGATP